MLAVLLSLVLLAGVVWCFAAGGSAADPLISLSYLTSTVRDALLKTAGDETAQSVGTLTDGWRSRLKTAAESWDEAAGSDGFEPLTASEGDRVELAPFACFMPLSGSAVLRVRSGDVIDLSLGAVVADGAALQPYHKYFAAENASAYVRAYGSVSAMRDGAAQLYADGAIPAEEMFDDLFGHWALPYVSRLYNLGIVDGTGKHAFSPEVKVTRGMLVTILGRVYGVAPEAYTDTRFSDVDVRVWYGPYVAWAEAVGIVDGFENGTFRPEDNITREQMALIFARFAAHIGASLPESEAEPFADRGSIDTWALEAVEYAQRTGLINGKDGNRFDPLGTATRAEMCAVASRFLEQAGLA